MHSATKGLSADRLEKLDAQVAAINGAEGVAVSAATKDIERD